MSALPPNNNRESRLPQTVMSALPPKADVCGATRDVRFVPIADISSSDVKSAIFNDLVDHLLDHEFAYCRWW